MKKAKIHSLMIAVALILVFVMPAAVFAIDNTPTLTGTVIEVQKYGNLTNGLEAQGALRRGF